MLDRSHATVGSRNMMDGEPVFRNIFILLRCAVDPVSCALTCLRLHREVGFFLTSCALSMIKRVGVGWMKSELYWDILF